MPPVDLMSGCSLAYQNNQPTLFHARVIFREVKANTGSMKLLNEWRGIRVFALLFDDYDLSLYAPFSIGSFSDVTTV